MDVLLRRPLRAPRLRVRPLRLSVFNPWRINQVIHVRILTESPAFEMNPTVRQSSSIRRRVGAHFVAVALTFVLLATPGAWADDVVYLKSLSNPRARTKISGQIVDYTGKELVLRTDTGAPRRFPSEQVADIETAWSAEQLAGDAMLAQHEFAAALAQYQLALKKDERRWVRRKIIADMIWCYRGLDQLGRAGELFLILVRDDPATPYYACIPLNWLNREPSPDVEQRAREWLARGEVAEAGLLAASHLLPTAERGAALKRLDTLLAEKDPRIAALAQALVFSASSASVGDSQLAAWRDRVERFPAALRGGPYFVLGRALEKHHDLAGAALAFLRVPIESPRERFLAAAALFEAGQALEKSGQPRDAARLYQELATDYAPSRYASEAKRRLETLEAHGQSLTTKTADGQTAVGPANDERFLDGLRQRRLNALAEEFCRDRLRRTDLDESRRAEMTIELSRSLVEHALESPPGDSADLWRQALKATDDFAQRSPHSPRLLQVRVQHGLVLLARGQLLREEAEVMADRGGRLDAARDDLRKAIDELKRAGADVAEQLRRQPPKAQGDAAEFTPPELLSLQKNVSYQLARALRNQGQSYPANSADRSASLVQAAELLGPLAQSEPTDPLAWPSRLDEITCYRLLGDEAAALRRLELLERQKPPPRVLLAARAQRIRLALAAKNVGDALAVLDKGRDEAGETSPELDLAFLETYLQAWQAAVEAKRSEAAAQWQSQAAAIVQQIDRAYGGYWARRAESLLAERVAGSTGIGDLTVLVRAAEGFYRAGQIDDALLAYDRARETARNNRDAAQAFDLGYTAAAVEQARQHFAAAADRFHELALANPRHEKAPDAHLLAIYNTNRAERVDTQSAEQHTSHNAQLLKEHLALWSQGPSADQARLWLARQRQQEQAWLEAIALYQAIRPDGAQADEAVQSVAACYRAVLAELRAQGKPTDETAVAAARYFESVITGAGGRRPRRFTSSQLDAAVEAAKLWLELAGDGFARAERILSAALAAAENAPEKWTASARGLLVYSLAGQGRNDEAARVLDQLKNGPPAELLSLVEGLVTLCESAAPGVRRDLAALALRVTALLDTRSDHLDEPQRRTLALLHAQSMAASGRTDDALADLERLAKESPRDGRIQEEYARVVFVAGRDDALEKWREVEKKSRRGSDRWFRAKYYQALAHERQGDKQAAALIVKLLRAQYPELGGTDLKPKFLDVLARCQRGETPHDCGERGGVSPRSISRETPVRIIPQPAGSHRPAHTGRSPWAALRPSKRLHRLPRPADVVHAELVGMAGPVGRGGKPNAAGGGARIGSLVLVPDGTDLGVRHPPAPLGLPAGSGRNDQGHGLAPGQVIVSAVPGLLLGLELGVLVSQRRTGFGRCRGGQHASSQ